jgi:two-component system NtrC family sensor kinase
MDTMSFCVPAQINSLDTRREFYEHGLGFLACTSLDYADVRQFLLLARQSGEPAFNELELETLRILVRQAVVALENAQLYDELQKHIRQLETSQHALAQAEKMAAVGRLTAAIAHEINNPLHSIRNCLHLAGRNELSEDNRQEYLELAGEETERLMHTVRQMLDFYRPSALDRKPANLNNLIDRVVKLLDAQFAAHQVVLARRYAPNLPLVLLVENQIQQVFFNLFLNAVEAMPSGGKITITTAYRDGNVLALVADSGPGITLNEREDIFGPFVSSKEKGLGLGLTVSYGVVTAHGGSLTLLPEGDRGACFQVLLPAYE